MRLSKYTKISPINTEHEISNQHLNNLPYTGLTTTNGLSYANIVKGMASNSNELLVKRMDSLLTKMQEESNSTRHSIEELKHEIPNSLRNELINEWLTISSYNELELKWKHYQEANERHGYSSSSLNILFFNVRGFDLRWGEACAALSNYNIHYQAGENAHGDILAMIQTDIRVVRLDCSLPNICILDLQWEQIIRLLAIYVDLSPFITNHCMIMRDFNIDIEQDGDLADNFLEWMDSCNLEPAVLDSNMSLRSSRTIDYAITVGVELSMHSIPQDLMKLLAQSHLLSFKAKRKRDIELRKEARRLRNLARFELKRFQKEQLTKQLEEGHFPGDTSRLI
ncbi:unnamed protein product [Rotaria socialis]|uniref:Uncharacterized protein n=1 Tax=Rotaria socialis TaxID=392032 RepID=A0A818GJA9_9BILA|nr:unnamed protein product [Rotaria socialis]